jgi:CPA2 family monovalent cation:H+ antiporter-2
VLTVLLATVSSLLLALLLPGWWNVSWQTALALGGIMSMSSTAIVIKLMAERLELESEHGKRVVGILLFQDLAVVPLLVLIPALGCRGGRPAAGARLRAAQGGGAAGLLLTGGQR